MVRSHAEGQVHLCSPIQGLCIENPRGADPPARCAHWIRAKFTLAPRLKAWGMHSPQEQLMFLGGEELQLSLFHVCIYYCAQIPGALQGQCLQTYNFG